MEKLELTWVGKKECVNVASIANDKKLVQVKGHGVDEENTQNLLIEGDNLDAMKALLPNYAGKVDMIYIDPPYNTRKDFIYSDKWKKNKQEDRHSGWLCMMYPRLQLMKQLLKMGGVICVSIDDKEVANLRLLMDEIFGEDNFIAILSVENNPKGRKNSNFVSVSNEYCLLYAKDKTKSYFLETIPKDVKSIKTDEYGNKYTHGKRVLVGESTNPAIQKYDSDKHYTVYYKEIEKILCFKKEQSLQDKDEQLLSNGYKRYLSFKDSSFVENTYTQDYLQTLFDNKCLLFKSEGIYEKDLNLYTRIKSLVTNDVQKGIDLKTETASKYLYGMETVFQNPKNVSYLSLLFNLIDNKNAVILDCFAGSGTTGHAVMKLNAEDGGTRQYICVQIPEALDPKNKNQATACDFLDGIAKPRTIAEITKERLRRAGAKIRQEHPDFQGDLGFKVFKLE